MAEASKSFSIPRLSGRAIIVLLFFAALWIGLWWQLSGEWSVNDQYSYGWFVPFFAIVLFWLRFEDAPRTEVRGHRSQVSGSQGANFTAGGRELLANRPREAGDSVLVKTEWSVVAVIAL